MVGSADARPPAGGDAPRAFPARRSRRRTSAHPPLAEFGRVASRLALAGLALACSGVARVAAADPNGSYEIHAAIDAAFPEGARRGRTSPPRSPRTIFPAKNAPPRNHHQKTANQDETSVSPRPRPARSHRLGHRHVLAVPPAPERHLPHHPVRGARRREGDPGAGRARIDGAIVVAVALVRFVVRRRPARRQPGVPQGGIHRVPRGVRRPGRRGYRREGAQLRAINRRRSAKRRPRRVRPIDRRIRRQTRGGRHVQGLHRLRVRPLARVAVPPAGRAGVWRRVRPAGGVQRLARRDDRRGKGGGGGIRRV